MDNIIDILSCMQMFNSADDETKERIAELVEQIPTSSYSSSVASLVNNIKTGYDTVTINDLDLHNVSNATYFDATHKTPRELDLEVLLEDKDRIIENLKFASEDKDHIIENLKFAMDIIKESNERLVKEKQEIQDEYDRINEELMKEKQENQYKISQKDGIKDGNWYNDPSQMNAIMNAI